MPIGTCVPTHPSLRPIPVLQRTFEEIDGVGEIAERLASFPSDVLGVGLLFALVVIAHVAAPPEECPRRDEPEQHDGDAHAEDRSRPDPADDPPHRERPVRRSALSI